MRKFIFIVGAVACGKSIFIENRIYYSKENLINYFDPDKAKLMVQLYAHDKGSVNFKRQLEIIYEARRLITEVYYSMFKRDFPMELKYDVNIYERIYKYGIQ